MTKPTLAIAELPARAPETSSTDEAVTESLGVAESIVLQAIEDGRQGLRGGWASTWAVSRVLTENRVHHHPRMVASILKKLGYRIIGQSSQIIFQEGGTRPRIYSNVERPAGILDYFVDQGYRTEQMTAAIGAGIPA